MRLFSKTILFGFVLAFLVFGFALSSSADSPAVQFEDGSLAKTQRDPSGSRIDLVLSNPQSDRPGNAPLVLKRTPSGSLSITPASLLKLLEGKTAQYDELPPNIGEIIRTSQWFRQESVGGHSESIPAFVIDMPEHSAILFVQTNVSDRWRYLHVFNVNLATGKILHLLTEGFNGIKDLQLAPNGKRLSFTEFTSASGGRSERQGDARVVTIRTDKEDQKSAP